MPLVPQAAWHIRPLPRTLRPVHHETIDSYVARLAAANAVPTATLLAYVDATPSRRNQALLQRLATVSRQPPASLSHALVEFQYLGTGTPPWRNTFPRVWNDHGMAFPACQPCMAARGITTKVEVFVPFYRRICVQHSRWLDQRQLDLRNTPEIVRAQQRHRWITRRHGRQHAGDGFGDAVHIVERWLRRGNPQALHHRCWQPRLARLGETLQALEVHVPVLHAVTYPEIVALTGMLASPFWTAMANSDHAVNRDRFYRETARRLGVPSVDPTDSLDPLFQWTYDLRYGQIGR